MRVRIQFLKKIFETSNMGRSVEFSIQASFIDDPSKNKESADVQAALRNILEKDHFQKVIKTALYDALQTEKDVRESVKK